MRQVDNRPNPSQILTDLQRNHCQGKLHHFLGFQTVNKTFANLFNNDISSTKSQKNLSNLLFLCYWMKKCVKKIIFFLFFPPLFDVWWRHKVWLKKGFEALNFQALKSLLRNVEIISLEINHVASPVSCLFKFVCWVGLDCRCGHAISPKVKFSFQRSYTFSGYYGFWIQISHFLCKSFIVYFLCFKQMIFCLHLSKIKMLYRLSFDWDFLLTLYDNNKTFFSWFFKLFQNKKLKNMEHQKVNLPSILFLSPLPFFNFCKQYHLHWRRPKLTY